MASPLENGNSDIAAIKKNSPAVVNTLDSLIQIAQDPDISGEKKSQIEGFLQKNIESNNNGGIDENEFKKEAERLIQDAKNAQQAIKQEIESASVNGITSDIIEKKIKKTPIEQLRTELNTTLSATEAALNRKDYDGWKFLNSNTWESGHWNMLTFESNPSDLSEEELKKISQLEKDDIQVFMKQIRDAMAAPLGKPVEILGFSVKFESEAVKLATLQIIAQKIQEVVNKWPDAWGAITGSIGLLLGYTAGVTVLNYTGEKIRIHRGVSIPEGKAGTNAADKVVGKVVEKAPIVELIPGVSERAHNVFEWKVLTPDAMEELDKMISQNIPNADSAALTKIKWEFESKYFQPSSKSQISIEEAGLKMVAAASGEYRMGWRFNPFKVFNVLTNLKSNANLWVWGDMSSRWSQLDNILAYFNKNYGSALKTKAGFGIKETAAIQFELDVNDSEYVSFEKVTADYESLRSEYAKDRHRKAKQLESLDELYANRLNEEFTKIQWEIDAAADSGTLKALEKRMEILKKYSTKLSSSNKYANLEAAYKAKKFPVEMPDLVKGLQYDLDGDKFLFDIDSAEEKVRSVILSDDGGKLISVANENGVKENKTVKEFLLTRLSNLKDRAYAAFNGAKYPRDVVNFLNNTIGEHATGDAIDARAKVYNDLLAKYPDLRNDVLNPALTEWKKKFHPEMKPSTQQQVQEILDSIDGYKKRGNITRLKKAIDDVKMNPDLTPDALAKINKGYKAVIDELEDDIFKLRNLANASPEGKNAKKIEAERLRILDRVGDNLDFQIEINSAAGNAEEVTRLAWLRTPTTPRSVGPVITPVEATPATAPAKSAPKAKKVAIKPAASPLIPEAQRTTVPSSVKPEELHPSLKGRLVQKIQAYSELNAISKAMEAGRDIPVADIAEQLKKLQLLESNSDVKKVLQELEESLGRAFGATNAKLSSKSELAKGLRNIFSKELTSGRVIDQEALALWKTLVRAFKQAIVHR